MNLLDYVILVCIAVLLFFAARYAFRHRHSECGGDCSNCPYHKNCENSEHKGKK